MDRIILERGGTDEEAVYACIAAARKGGTMAQKAFFAPLELKADGEEGSFSAVFATLNVIDHDGDVTVPGAFRDGQKVRIAYWGHRWQDLPVGKGVIHADEEKAWVDGRFFLDTNAGLETYRTVKALEELQEWSYGFDIEKWSVGKFADREVRFLEGLNVHEVSPVMLGAGIGTQTTAIKAADGRGDGAGGGNGGQAGQGSGSPSGPPPQVMEAEIDILLMEEV
jgi:HK97 family phage prohead protease